MVCSDRREVSFYRDARVLRGREEVDHGAAPSASYRARRCGGSVLRLLAMLLAATTGSGGGLVGRVASATGASAADRGSLLRRRRARVVVEIMSRRDAVSR